MHDKSSKQQSALAAACALAFGVFSAVAGAQAVQSDEKSLLMDSQGRPVMSGHGLCWHSAFGPAPAWNAACHDPLPAPRAAAVSPAAAPALTESARFDADVLFDSGKSDLRPAGREGLDAFIGKIAGLEGESIIAVGHADRMGSTASNQALSEARVATVKAYLVANGVAAERVQTSGAGETRPATFEGDCKEANNAANVACMQADRVVTIEVSSSRIAR
jgi:OmpA-OmpF porin, OOP family